MQLVVVVVVVLVAVMLVAVVLGLAWCRLSAPSLAMS